VCKAVPHKVARQVCHQTKTATHTTPAVLVGVQRKVSVQPIAGGVIAGGAIAGGAIAGGHIAGGAIAGGAIGGGVIAGGAIHGAAIGGLRRW